MTWLAVVAVDSAFGMVVVVTVVVVVEVEKVPTNSSMNGSAISLCRRQVHENPLV